MEEFIDGKQLLGERLAPPKRKRQKAPRRRDSTYYTHTCKDIYVYDSKCIPCIRLARIMKVLATTGPYDQPFSRPERSDWRI